ncbi:MAG: hypothetical protein KAX39_07435, partial [candidate division Zixibacteria bacterium]|nr:hypothetical protein [candidate division Zixibacteria bacterium]
LRLRTSSPAKGGTSTFTTAWSKAKIGSHRDNDPMGIWRERLFHNFYLTGIEILGYTYIRHPDPLSGLFHMNNIIPEKVKDVYTFI